jgi:hypothetical protein
MLRAESDVPLYVGMLSWRTALLELRKCLSVIGVPQKVVTAVNQLTIFCHEGHDLSLLYNVQAGFGAQTASYQMGTVGDFPDHEGNPHIHRKNGWVIPPLSHVSMIYLFI